VRQLWAIVRQLALRSSTVWPEYIADSSHGGEAKLANKKQRLCSKTYTQVTTVEPFPRRKSVKIAPALCL